MLGDSHLFASNNRADKVLMCRLRTFIEDPVCDEAEDGDVTLACKLYVGGSAILPSTYRFLGVSRGEKERQAMQSARDAAMRELPKEYREGSSRISVAKQRGITFASLGGCFRQSRNAIAAEDTVRALGLQIFSRRSHLYGTFLKLKSNLSKTSRHASNAPLNSRAADGCCAAVPHSKV